MDKKYWFFGSKLNTVLLAVLIILMIIAIKIMLQNKETYLPELNKQNQTEETVMDTVEYKNTELGFSFSYPSKYDSIKLISGATSIISPGETGKSFMGILSWDINNFFYFGGLTPNYEAGHDGNIGIINEINCSDKKNNFPVTSTPVYGISKNGSKYAYFNILDAGDINDNGHWYAAYFTLNHLGFPCLGFAAKSNPITENEFLKVINSVKIY